MIEIFLGGFWAVTYILIVVLGAIYHRSKQVFMPLISGMFNFAWEIFALIESGGYWVHIVWLLLDCFILAYNIYILDGWKKKIVYGILVSACIVGLYFVFRIKSFDGMLISSFVIDVVMSIEYLIFSNRLSNKGQITIGLCRLLGDFFAWYSNKGISRFVYIAGIIVFAVNVIYVGSCMIRVAEKCLENKKAKTKNKRCR